MTRKRKTKRLTLGDADNEPSNPVGRPNEGLSEKIVTFRAPQEIADAMSEYATAHELNTSETWRRAARAFLGLENRLPEDDA